MTVSRRGKRGTIKLRPASRNGRVRTTAAMNNICKEQDNRPVANRISKERWVINCVSRVVGSKAGSGFVQADDVASDILLMLLDAGGFQWEEEEIEVFCRRKAAYMVRQYVSRREKSECEFVSADGDLIPIANLNTYAPACQDTAFDAMTARLLLAALPTLHRQALEILCDGGNPVDVAEEMDLKPWEAIRIIREARDYIHRVGPMDEAA